MATSPGDLEPVGPSTRRRVLRSAVWLTITGVSLSRRRRGGDGVSLLVVTRR